MMVLSPYSCRCAARLFTSGERGALQPDEQAHRISLRAASPSINRITAFSNLSRCLGEIVPGFFAGEGVNSKANSARSPTKRQASSVKAVISRLAWISASWL